MRIPPTSVEAERVFSASGLILTKIRSRLNDSSIDMLVFLKKISSKCSYLMVLRVSFVITNTQKTRTTDRKRYIPNSQIYGECVYFFSFFSLILFSFLFFTFFSFSSFFVFISIFRYSFYNGNL